jgi:nitrite reductase/ring-hydroxylating ferredoxin subunit
MYNLSCSYHAKFDLKDGKMIKNVPGLMKMATGGAKDFNPYKLKVENEEIKL